MWYPCKDLQSDEPDQGASLTMIVPDSLVGVSNGRLISKQKLKDGNTAYKWAVVNPINNYDIIPYIGKYVNFNEVYQGEKDKLDVNYWVLNYNQDRAKAHMVPEVHRTLKAFEYWFGPYPFYEDGYKLVDAPYEGMEHQSAIAYGNGYQNGQEGYDESGTGLGMKWDLIIVHESAHEWFGNNITTDDIADMWVHEGFGNYSQTLFTEFWYGSEAGSTYDIGERQNIQNAFPIIGYYGLNDQIADRNQDIYTKGGQLIDAIRHTIDNDSTFRGILRGLNKTFYHKTVTSSQVENYISQQASFDYSKVFDQYLRTVQIPQFDYYFSDDKKSVFYRYSNCIKNFNLPLVLKNEGVKLKIFPSPQWKSIAVNPEKAALFNHLIIENSYFLTANQGMKK